MELTQGRNRKCKLNIGGLKVAYFFAFEKYKRSEIIVDGVKLISFPNTVIYPFEIINSVFSESTQENESKTQNLTIEMIGVEVNSDLQKLVNKDHRVIALDRNGNYRLIGAYNGVLTDLEQTTGGTQAEFNGYRLSVEGNEKTTALFIDNLEDAGFEIYDPTSVSCLELIQGGNLELIQSGCLELIN